MSKKIKYAPLRYDVVFKGFFSKEDNKEFLVSMLQSYLDLDIKSKNDIELVNTELIPDKLDDKQSRLDLKVKTANGENINVEIQLLMQADFLQRIYYYNSKMYVNQAIKGKSYKDLNKSITLAFTMFDVFKDYSGYKNNIYLYHEETKARVLEDIHIAVIELSKYMRLTNNNEVANDDWADLLIANSNDEFKTIERRGGIMAEAVRKLKFFSQEEVDRYWPEMIEKYEMDMRSNEQYWQAIGEKRGESRGIAIGEIRGMLALGADNAKITELTGATEEEIQEIKNNM